MTIILRLLWTIGIMSMGVRETDSYYSQCLNGYCYSTVKTLYLNLTDAIATCQRNGSYLATITSQDQQNSIVNFINKAFAFDAGELSSATRFLLNAKRIGNTWTWANGRALQPALKNDLYDASWLTHARIERAYNYTRLYADQSFDNISFICGYSGGKSTCNGGLYFNNTCYITNSTQLTWFEARYSCLQNGGDLAMLDFANSTQDLNVFNDSFLNSNTRYWIGLKRHSWYWENPAEVEFTYTSWGQDRPLYYGDSYCSCLDYNFLWKWKECNCDKSLPFICLKTTDTNTTTMSTTPQLPMSASLSSTTTSRPSASSSSTSTSSPSTSSSSTLISRPSTFSSPASFPANFTDPPPISSLSASTPSASTPSLSVDSSSASNTSINTQHLAIAIGVGVGVPLVLGLVILVIIVYRQWKKFSYQMRLLTDIIGDVYGPQSSVKEDPTIGVNGSVEMTSEQNPSPYESLRHDETALNDGNYEELRISGGREAIDPETHDYETVP